MNLSKFRQNRSLREEFNDHQKTLMEGGMIFLKDGKGFICHE
jgi:hypothetical protein